MWFGGTVMSDEMDNTRDGLRGASDGLLVAIQEVEHRERKKRGVSPTDPGFPALARDVTTAAKAVLELARVEETEADAIAARHAAAALPTIEATPPPERLADILAEWRAVERRLAAADAMSTEATQLMQQFDALKDRYAQALKAYRD
jgi:hypothetical protein